MKEYFIENGWVTSFGNDEKIISPILFQNIYKGALGEVAGKFILNRELGIELSPITEPEFFEFFDYKLGALQYRSVHFETEELDVEDFQGNAVVNYTEREVPYTRIIEHKHFEFGKQPTTVISREYSAEWKLGMEPYYPVNDADNGALYEKYKELADKQGNVIFGGRLGQYRYYDMDKVIRAALDDLKNI